MRFKSQIDMISYHKYSSKAKKYRPTYIMSSHQGLLHPEHTFLSTQNNNKGNKEDIRIQQKQK